MKLNVNHEIKSVSGAFAGEDKLDRIEDKLLILVNEGNKEGMSVSEVIQGAVELYADTVEEAIGISIAVFNGLKKIKEATMSHSIGDIIGDIVGKRQGLNGKTIGSPINSLDDLFKTLEKIDDIAKGSPEKAINALDEAMISSMGNDVRGHMSRQKCEECPLNGDCIKQTIADKKAPGWRDGRKL